MSRIKPLPRAEAPEAIQANYDAMFAIVKIMELMARYNVSLSAEASEIPAFETFHIKVPCPWDKKGLVMRKGIEAVQGMNYELVDGIKVFLDGAWVLMLPDPDEATFHIWVEAASKNQARALMKEYSQKLHTWQSPH